MKGLEVSLLAIVSATDKIGYALNSKQTPNNLPDIAILTFLLFF
jgi:hypothetical protein